MAGQKSYFCPSHPNGQFGEIKFVGGWYRTTRLSEQRFLESHKFFGWRIKLIPEIGAETVAEPDEVELIGMPVADPTTITANRNEAPVPNPPEAEPEPFKVPQYTKTKISRMRKAELEDLCQALDLEWEGRSVNQMRLAIKRELEIH